MMNSEKVGSFIAERRKKAGFTQQQVADKLNVSVQAVSKWEHGITYPNIELLMNLTEILGVSVDELLLGTSFDPEELVYHRADPGDIDVLVSTRIEVLRAANKLRSDTEMKIVEEESRKYFMSGFGSDSFAAYLVKDGDKIVGTGGVSFFQVMPTYHNPTGKKAYIMNMYTHPDYRRRGIAFRMLDILVCEIKKRGIKSIFLEATEMGRPLYIKYGFTVMPNEMELNP